MADDSSSSNDIDFEDARQDNDEILPAQPSPDVPQNIDNLNNQIDLLEEHVNIEANEPAEVALPIPPEQVIEEEPPLYAFGAINAQEIVRQVIENLWPVMGPPGVEMEDEENNGMDNVEDGYFDEEENGDGNESDDNSNAANDAAAPLTEFDLQLPTRHTYLGDWMEELQGRVVFDDNAPTTPEIPLIVMGIQLVPGQTLPLTIFHAVFQNAIRRCISSEKVFGIIHNQFDIHSGSMVYKGALGTIAEIYEFQEENEPPNGNMGLTTFALKAKGRQRFNVVSFRRQADGNLMGMVKIRPEIRLPPLVRNVISDQTHRYRFPVKRQIRDTDDDIANEPTTRKLAKTLSISSTSSSHDEETEDRQIVDSELAAMQEKITEQRKITKFYSALTPFPYFVYEQFDEQVLIEKVHRKLRVELKGLTESGSVIPKDATELSFWLAQNLTMDDHHRLKILQLDNPVQRLKYELDMLSRACKVITCRNCQITIADNSDIFAMSVEGPQGTYVNPQGYVHETLTVHKTTKDVVLKGISSTEASWFPGYSWTIAECRRCTNHLGWKFKALGRLKPAKFYGLARRSTSFKYNILTDDQGSDDVNSSSPQSMHY